MTRILVADDHPFVRCGVKHVLQDEFPGIEVGEVATAGELLAEAVKQPWDMIILDLTMPGRSGLDALHELRALCPETRVLVLSMHPEDQFAVRVLRAGAFGYLTKESIPNELVQGVRKIQAGSTSVRRSPSFSWANFSRGMMRSRLMPGCPIENFKSWR
jgi:DNA-binding NarL/FixJ family response regulator